MFTIIEACRRRSIDPWEYLRDVLIGLPTMTIQQISEVTPDAWAKAPAHERACQRHEATRRIALECAGPNKVKRSAMALGRTRTILRPTFTLDYLVFITNTPSQSAPGGLSRMASQRFIKTSDGLASE